MRAHAPRTDRVLTGVMDFAGIGRTTAQANHDPATGRKVSGRDVIRVIDDNKHTMEMYKIGPDKKEMKVMEITFTRKGK